MLCLCVCVCVSLSMLLLLVLPPARFHSNVMQSDDGATEILLKFSADTVLLHEHSPLLLWFLEQSGDRAGALVAIRKYIKASRRTKIQRSVIISRMVKRLVELDRMPAQITMESITTSTKCAAIRASWWLAGDMDAMLKVAHASRIHVAYLNGSHPANAVELSAIVGSLKVLTFPAATLQPFRHVNTDDLDQSAMEAFKSAKTTFETMLAQTGTQPYPTPPAAAATAAVGVTIGPMEVALAASATTNGTAVDPFAHHIHQQPASSSSSSSSAEMAVAAPLASSIHAGRQLLTPHAHANEQTNVFRRLCMQAMLPTPNRDFFIPPVTDARFFIEFVDTNFPDSGPMHQVAHELMLGAVSNVRGCPAYDPATFGSTKEAMSIVSAFPGAKIPPRKHPLVSSSADDGFWLK